MKTFQIFKEDLKKSLSPLKQFGQKFSKEAEKFAKSDDAKKLKSDVMNFFLDKGQEAINKGNAKLKDIKTKVNK